MKWQPIETAPKDGTVVLAFTASEGRRAMWPAYYKEDSGDWTQVSGPFIQPTHWMPMPEPPPVLPEVADEAWLPIDTAPKDGSLCRVKRVLDDGDILCEGLAYWGQRDPFFANVRESMFMDILITGKPIPDGWCVEGGKYYFPEPTHWVPAEVTHARNQDAPL